MLSRRRWLSLTALAAAPIRADNPLASRVSEASPITPAERLERVEKARRLMHEQKLDAIALTGGTSLEYFTGVRWWNSERLFLMLLPQRGEPVYVAPAFEEARVREQLGNPRARVLTWQEDDDPYALVAAGMRERGITSGRIGIEETVKFVFSNNIAKAVAAATLSSGTPVTAGCRMIKTSHELQLMQLANSVTLQAYEWAWRQLREGMTQLEFSGLISSAYSHLGFPGEASVQIGEFSALPHGSVQPQVIREGQMILIDDGCRVEGYQSDISRSFVLGKPTDKMRRVFDIVHRAQSAALQSARPGVPCGDVDAAARKVISDAGFGPGYKYFTHRVGHGIGMDGHEWPYLVRGNQQKLAAGMCFSDEPGIYIPGEFGIRLEDDMHITENGAELFTPPSSSLEHPFAP